MKSIKDRINAELVEIRSFNKGRLDPDDVWRYAKANPKSALHGQFDWNLRKAAESHWRAISQDLIKVYLIEYVRKPDKKMVVLAEYTSLSTERGKGRPSYEATVDILARPAKREQLLIDTIKRLLSIKEVAVFPELDAVAKAIAAAAERYVPKAAA